MISLKIAKDIRWQGCMQKGHRRSYMKRFAQPAWFLERKGTRCELHHSDLPILTSHILKRLWTNVLFNLFVNIFSNIFIVTINAYKP